jgi:hypothetical protein
MNLSARTRAAAPLFIALLSTVVSIAVAIAFVRAPSGAERAAAKISERLKIDTSTPERAAESFYNALGRCEFSWAFKLSCGRERQRLTKLKASSTSFSRPCEALEAGQHRSAADYPYLLFRDSFDFGNGSLGLRGFGRRDPKDDTRGVTVEFLVEKRSRRWCVEQMSYHRGKAR